MAYIGKKPSDVFPTSAELDTITSTNLNIDASGDITLDADGGNISIKDGGTSIGTIGVTSSDQIFFSRTTGSQGIKLKNSALMPSSADVSDSDNDQGLGSSSVRWKDLYLSGGAYIGGTGTANKLDDYEEGTWTPNADGGSTTHHDQFGFYTKVGNLVHAYFNLRINAYNGGSAVRYLFGGLPFPASSTSGKSGAGSIFYFGNIHTSAVALFCRVDPNNSAVYVSGTTGSVASMANINHPWATNNAQVIGFVMYRTD